MKLNAQLLSPILRLYTCTMSCRFGREHEQTIADNSEKQINAYTTFKQSEG